MNEAVYYVARRDADGELLDGRRRNYTLTFAAGSLPPVDTKGFWSVTMYKSSDNLLVPNAINRYVIRPSTPGLQPNADGSLTITMAAQKPLQVSEGNWLPAPPARLSRRLAGLSAERGDHGWNLVSASDPASPVGWPNPTHEPPHS